jgi:hypothetical protein
MNQLNFFYLITDKFPDVDHCTPGRSQYSNGLNLSVGMSIDIETILRRNDLFN